MATSCQQVVRETKLHIGRLDDLNEPERIEIEKKLEELGYPSLIQKFLSILLSRGYKFPSPVAVFSVENVYEYGRELALHKVCEEIYLRSTAMVIRAEDLMARPGY